MKIKFAFRKFIPARLLFLTGIVFILTGCAGNGKKPRVISGDDTMTSGTIHISADESFKPVIDSQIKVFLSQYPKANIVAHQHHHSNKACFDFCHL